MSQLVFRDTHTKRFDPYKSGGPVFSVVDPSGKTVIQKAGEEAFIANSPEAYRFDPSNRVQDLLVATNPDDPRHNSMKFKIMRKLKGIADDPSPNIIGNVLNRGPLVGGASGLAVGFGAGALGDWILDKINGGQRDSKLSLKVIGALSGGGMGSILGHYRKKYNSGGYMDNLGSDLEDLAGARHDLVKHAAMYKDPRNFILEKIQSATDISFSEKAKLAAAVRGMDRMAAERLAKAVRAALGTGVGAIVARYLFGMKSVRGTMFGGLVGLLGAGLYNKLMR